MDSIKDRLFFFITQRYQSHAARQLEDYIFSNRLFQSFETEFADFLFESHEGIFQYLSNAVNSAGLVEYCIRSTKEYTYKRNQYINFTRQYDELLLAEYQDLLVQIKNLSETARSREELFHSFGTVLQRHHERLRLILSSYCVITSQNELKNNPLLQTVPCEEYSARFQLDILRLDLEQIAEPVLDIGCGTEGALVKFLRNQGFEALGIDRLAPKEPFFYQSDWFDFDYNQRRWGTIIAHQSLSTHFIYNYLSNPAKAKSYVDLFMRILSSLDMNGKFCYAPGLPFFEDSLEKMERYEILRETISSDLSGIGEIAYAVQIKLLE
jgi:hypothetical protein